MEKRLYKSKNNRMLGGVCAGIAEYLGVDPTLVRLGTAVLSVGSCGWAILFYIIGLIIIPEQPMEDTYSQKKEDYSTYNDEDDL